MLTWELIVILKRNMHVCLREMLSAAREYYFARKHGVPYVQGFFVRRDEKGVFADSEGYGGSEFACFSKALDKLHITGDDVFVDLGCGRGRVVLFSALWRPKKIIGIELVKEFADQARSDAHRLSSKLQVPVEILCGDAALARLDEGTIYYLYHPFGMLTLNAVIENIRKSLEARPRRIRIIYYNPVYESLLVNTGWLVKTDQLVQRSLTKTIVISILESRKEPGCGDVAGKPGFAFAGEFA